MSTPGGIRYDELVLDDRVHDRVRDALASGAGASGEASLAESPKAA